MSASPVDATGRTSLGGLGALVARASLVVTNDTGISHIAAAIRTPSVVIGRNSDVARWAPADGTIHRYLTDSPHRPVTHGDVLRQALDLLPTPTASAEVAA